MASKALRANSDNEYKLCDDYMSCWVTVGNISVYIQRTDEGVAVDLWPCGMEDQPLSVSGTWLTFEEAQEDINVHNAQNIGA